MKKATSRKNARKTSNHSRKPMLKSIGKIKTFLRQSTKDFKNNAGKNMGVLRDKSDEVQEYLGERTFATMGVSLATGLATGIYIGYLINK